MKTIAVWKKVNDRVYLNDSISVFWKCDRTN